MKKSRAERSTLTTHVKRSTSYVEYTLDGKQRIALKNRNTQTFSVTRKSRMKKSRAERSSRANYVNNINYVEYTRGKQMERIT